MFILSGFHITISILFVFHHISEWKGWCQFYVTLIYYVLVMKFVVPIIFEGINIFETITEYRIHSITWNCTTRHYFLRFVQFGILGILFNFIILNAYLKFFMFIKENKH